MTWQGRVAMRLRRKVPSAGRPAARALVALALLAGAGCRPAPEGAGLPPVIVHVVDTLRADHLSIHGYTRDTSPALAALANDAIVFERAYAPSSWTKPSTASLLTGLSPERHAAVTRAHVLPEGHTLLAERLAEAGYHTAAFTTNPWIAPKWGFGQGFRYFDPTPRLAGPLVDAALAHLEAGHSERFFYYLHALDPHAPYRPTQQPGAPPRRFPGRVVQEKEIRPGIPAAQLADAVAAYDGQILYGDHHFGRLLDRLRAEGLYDRALVLFTADHGEEFLEHDGAGHGRTLYDEVLHVPFVLKLPGNRHAGLRVAEPVSLIDAVPTILAALGLPRGEALEGLDLVAHLEQREVLAERELFFDLDLVHATDGHHRARGVIRGAEKLVSEQTPEARVLYFDLARDPGEIDAAADGPGRARLREALERRGARGAGFHLALVNDPGRRAPDRSYRGVLRARGGRFSAFETRHFEADDRAVLSEDATRIEFRVASRNVLRRGPNASPIFEVDEDWIRVQLDPPDASLELAGFDAPVHLGPARTVLAELPARLGAGDPRLAIADPAALFARGLHHSSEAPPGAYLVFVPGAERRELDALDAEEQERLRALGYLEE